MSEPVKGLSDDTDDAYDAYEDCDYEGPAQDYNSRHEEPRARSAKKKSKKTDLMKMTGNMLSNINYKVAFMLFAISMILFSDVFIEGVLNGFSGAVEGDCTTTKGTMIQLLFMVMAYIILDLIVKYEVL